MSTQQTPTADLTDIIAARQEQGYASIDRDEAIKAIRTALKRRTGKTWSVKGGRGTAWGWLTITCLLYTSPSPRDRTRSRMPSSA